MADFGQTIRSPSFSVETPNDPDAQVRQFHLKMEFPANTDVKMNGPEGYKDDDDAYFPVFPVFPVFLVKKFEKENMGAAYYPVYLVNETTSGGDVLVKLKEIHFGDDNAEEYYDIERFKTAYNFVTLCADPPFPASVILDVEVNLSKVAGTVVA